MKPPAAQRVLRRLRRVHFWVAAVFTAYFVLLMATGVAIQHREYLGLERAAVSRRWLPSGYRPQEAEVRADIVITDLHSGRIFGPSGPLLADAAVAAWLALVLTGFAMSALSRRTRNNCKEKR